MQNGTESDSASIAFNHVLIIFIFKYTLQKQVCKSQCPFTLGQTQKQHWQLLEGCSEGSICHWLPLQSLLTVQLAQDGKHLFFNRSPSAFSDSSDIAVKYTEWEQQSGNQINPLPFCRFFRETPADLENISLQFSVIQPHGQGNKGRTLYMHQPKKRSQCVMVGAKGKLSLKLGS